VSEECLLCKVVDNICDVLPTDEAKRKCKELTKRIEKGEVDGTTARQELLKHIDEKTFDKIVRETLPKLLSRSLGEDKYG
jgi:hypothetical protein